MSEWNTYYRAFLEYKKGTAKDKSVQKLCEAIARSSSDGDSLDSIRTYCVIEEDWIQIIEEGMEHVEKAIREERQFIRKEGEVVPIEKLKRVSTATVQHLARHSDLITKEPEEGEPLIPERLYMAENLSDFTVYENRFLYMLLCYLRDFISVRLDKILELGRTYTMRTEIDKNVRVGKKHLKYKTSVYYEDKNDKLADEYSPSSPLIERIETAQRLVVSLLMTPLMKEVSKAPMLTPPITRTNVLRMNVHFKAALEMYGKLVAYNKPGYKIEEIKNSFRPLPDALMAELSEVIALNRFLSYKYGNGLSERLRKEYEAEEQAKREQEAVDRRAKLEAMRAKIEAGHGSMEEYIELLEAELKQREKDSADFRVAQKQIENLNARVEELTAEITSLNDRNEKLLSTIAEKDDELRGWEQKLAEEKYKLEKECNEYKRETDKKCAEELLKVEEKLRDGEAELAQKAQELEIEKAKNEEARIFAQAQLHGLREQYGLTTDEEDYTNKERFLELEQEYAAFKKFFEKEWGQTKKSIRKKILWQKPKS